MKIIAEFTFELFLLDYLRPQRPGGAAMTKPTKNLRKIKYFKMEFKVTESQRKELRQYCSKYGTTSKRMFRRAVMELMQRSYIKHSAPISYVSENQMSIFDIVEDPSVIKG